MEALCSLKMVVTGGREQSVSEHEPRCVGVAGHVTRRCESLNKNAASLYLYLHHLFHNLRVLGEVFNRLKRNI